MPAVYGVIGQRHLNTGGGGSYGPSEFSDFEYLSQVLEQHRPDITRVVSGGARGLEVMVEKWSHLHRLPFSLIKPALSIFSQNVPEKIKGIEAAFMVRNHEIINGSDRLIVFWDGAEHMILAATASAIKSGKSVYVYPISRPQ